MLLENIILCSLQCCDDRKSVFCVFFMFSVLCSDWIENILFLILLTIENLWFFCFVFWLNWRCSIHLISQLFSCSTLSERKQYKMSENFWFICNIIIVFPNSSLSHPGCYPVTFGITHIIAKCGTSRASYVHIGIHAHVQLFDVRHILENKFLEVFFHFFLL